MTSINKEMLNYYIEEGYKAIEEKNIYGIKRFHTHAKTTLTELLKENFFGEGAPKGIDDKPIKRFYFKKFREFKEKIKQYLEKEVLVLTEDYRILEPAKIKMTAYNPINKSFIKTLKGYENRKSSKTKEIPTKKNKISQKTLKQTQKLLQSQNKKEIESYISKLEKHFIQSKKIVKQTKRLLQNQNKKEIESYISKLEKPTILEKIKTTYANILAFQQQYF